MGRLLRHIKDAIWKYKIYLSPCQSYSWKPGDHKHVCYAVRILDRKDFEQICPIHNGVYPEHSMRCEDCPYFGEVDFVTDNGKKKALFYIPKEAMAEPEDDNYFTDDNIPLSELLY